MKDDLLLGNPYAGPKVDPRDYPSIKCSKCGSVLFESSVVMKEIPGTIVGNGTEPLLYPLQVLVCKKCGKVLDADVKAYKLEKELGEEETKNSSSNLLIS